MNTPVTFRFLQAKGATSPSTSSQGMPSRWRPGVDFQVHRDPAALGGQGPGVVGADHRLGQAVPGQQGNLPGAGVTQHQDGAQHAAPPQARTLGGGGYGEGTDALPGADAGNLQIPGP